MFKLLAWLAVFVPAGCQDWAWGYECIQNKCVKVPLNETNFQKAAGLSACRMLCGDTIGTLWPNPTGPMKIGDRVIHIDRQNVNFEVPTGKAAALWKQNEQRFMQQIDAKVAGFGLPRNGGTSLYVRVIVDESQEMMPRLTYDTDESYTLHISQGNGKVFADIKAKTFFGARHGLETLSQLIVYDDIRREVQMLAQAEISDAPAYKHRGLLLDTARHYFSVKSIKRTLDGMAMAKLNTFHWHITDSDSFPMVVKSQPDLHKLGAYSARKIYTHEDIAGVVEYARARGVRVLPELDAPAHVGAGWPPNMTTCASAQPWPKYCNKPPCGQLSPVVDGVYDVLYNIYREMFELFDPDVFHMGGDDVSMKCWSSSPTIRNWMLRRGWGLEEKDFMKLWGYFQNKALSLVDSISKNGKVPVILRDSALTDVPFVEQYLDKNRYILHAAQPRQETLKRGYKMIITNYEALYFECGLSNCYTDGNNWGSPYIGWQKVYENSLEKLTGSFNHLILGAEAGIWTEQTDEHTLDSRIWPRAGALAERLWSNPKDNWRSAEARMLMHRERLTENGIAAETLQPEWCLQNQNECPR